MARPSNSELLATFSAAAGQNGTAIFGGHPGTETMSTLALQIAGLKCSFHGANLPFKYTNRVSH
jgi:hypothetical protein